MTFYLAILELGNLLPKNQNKLLTYFLLLYQKLFLRL